MGQTYSVYWFCSSHIVKGILDAFQRLKYKIVFTIKIPAYQNISYKIDDDDPDRVRQSLVIRGIDDFEA